MEFAEEPAEDTYATPARVVALYDFDPSSIDWPFVRQRPLALTTGQVVEVLHDDGGEWALGCLPGRQEAKGYFPKNYTVSVNEYTDMTKTYEKEQDEDDAEEEDIKHEEVPKTSAIPQSLPTLDRKEPHIFDDLEETMKPAPEKAAKEDLPELVYPALVKYPPLDAHPPLPTAMSMQKSRLLREMPAVPEKAYKAVAPPEDEIVEARLEVEHELELLRDPMAIQPGLLSHSRCSTPAGYAGVRPERDFVRKDRNAGPSTKPSQRMREVGSMEDLRKHVFVRFDKRQAYKTDLRARHTTIRMAAGIEPPMMRMALLRAAGSGAKWTQMFRPGYNDIVNEAFKVGCNACILSKLYLKSENMRELFQRIHIKDVNGTHWYDLQRRKQHLFHMRMESKDVLMCHPDAWGFPDATRVIGSNPGEPANPFHGWLAQGSIDPDREMEDVQFTYSVRMRALPDRVFQGLALGKIPEWVRNYLTLHGEAEAEVDKEAEEDEAALGGLAGKNVSTQGNLMMEAGLEDGEDLYVKLDELRLARERTAGPDVLTVKPLKGDGASTSATYTLRGLNAMRIFLRSRGNPDNMKQAHVSPKMVKDMALQLGIKNLPSSYWYCLFALRYPLDGYWDVIIKNDTRWYLNLEKDRVQPVHPLIKRFREHLADVIQNEELMWEFRGFVKMRCSECGVPDSVVWCMQCADYFCASCFLHTHKSKRGHKHWPMPVPGARYLTATEAQQFEEHIPLLNVGFSNRRRFLARDNQSDRNGSRCGDSWLHFHADTFQAALVQTPKSHWLLKRKDPPRLPPGADGYYYNFATDTLADDASYILTQAHEQKAVSKLQKFFRGVLTRMKIKRLTATAIVIQKTKVMWDVQQQHGMHSTNSKLLRKWYQGYKSAKDRVKLELLWAKVQAACRGFSTRRNLLRGYTMATKIQTVFRRYLAIKRRAKQRAAIIKISKVVRGHLCRLAMERRWKCAARIQAMVRGRSLRALLAKRRAAGTRILAHLKGVLGRKYVKLIMLSATKIQRNWRRFQAQLDVKLKIYDQFEKIRQKRLDVIRQKSAVSAAVLIQRNIRRHWGQQEAMDLRREKGEADTRTSTMLVAIYCAISEARNFIHPWWRHLPREIQEVLSEMKGSMQRTIASAPVTGKLANEELGRRGLRVQSEEHLTYKQDHHEPDIASHMLLSVSRHLLSHVPAESFATTLKWACAAIGHQAVKLNDTTVSGSPSTTLASYLAISRGLPAPPPPPKGYFPKEEVVVGKEMPPHPNDTLHNLYKDAERVRQKIDDKIVLPNESLPILVLYGMPTQSRHVFLTAEVLVTMRQALLAPSVGVDDHLKFQGLDASAGAQLMEVLGSELDHRLPRDWPNTYGTVAAMAAQLGNYISQLQPQSAEKRPDTRGGAQKAKKKEGDEGSSPGSGEPGPLSYFNRTATMRVLQQIAYLMRDQDHLLSAVLNDEEGGSKGKGVHKSRYVVAADRLFETADQAEYDHCSFVLAVVIFHMVLRGLFMRLLFHRSAMKLQAWWHHLKQSFQRRGRQQPTIKIQSHWRGLRVRLMVYRWNASAETIQSSFRAWRWNRRVQSLLKATLFIQRVTTGAIYRFWLRRCHEAAMNIQRFGRGMLVRMMLDRSGRELVRKKQEEFTALLKQRDTLGESMYIAQSALLAAKTSIAMHKHRERNIELRRLASFTMKSKQARVMDKARRLKNRGAIQAARSSVFEPIVVAERRSQRREPRYGATRSTVQEAVQAARRSMDRMTKVEVEKGNGKTKKLHKAARAGQAAMAARRLARHPEVNAPKEAVLDDLLFSSWMSSQLVKQ